MVLQSEKMQNTINNIKSKQLKIKLPLQKFKVRT